VQVRYTSNLRPLRLGEEKKKKAETRKKEQDENIMSASATQGSHNKTMARRLSSLPLSLSHDTPADGLSNDTAPEVRTLAESIRRERRREGGR